MAEIKVANGTEEHDRSTPKRQTMGPVCQMDARLVVLTCCKCVGK